MKILALMMALVLGLVTAALGVDAGPTETPPPDAPAAATIREIVKIQEQLGGSIVRGSALDELAPPAALPSSVSALREAAWQLDKSAHHLEALDLYDQADALREMANEFRQEARDLKGAAEKSE